MLILIMMKMVVAPERFHPFEWGIPGMDGIVHRTIHQVADDKSREEHKSDLTQQKVLAEKYEGSQYNAGHRRHEQPFFVAWIMMVVAMHDVDDLFGPFALRHIMEHEPVHQVLEKSPEQHARREKHHDLPGRISELNQRVIH